MGRSSLRRPVVAGQFYPSSAQGLKTQIQAFLNGVSRGSDGVGRQEDRLDILACMLPHAGYAYSGGVAVNTVSRIKIKDKIVLLGPNHKGYGDAFSVMREGIWQTPLGEIKIDVTLAERILAHSKYLKEDTLAHAYEHSLEVELPILQYFKSAFEIVPIAILSGDINALKEIGQEVAYAIKESNARDAVMIVASSDMTHYEPQDQARKKDMEAIAAILELDEDKLMERIQQLHISMCGFAPVIAMLSAAKILGARRGELIQYQTSGDITGDKNSVVGYAGVIIY